MSDVPETPFSPILFNMSILHARPKHKGVSFFCPHRPVQIVEVDVCCGQRCTYESSTNAKKQYRRVSKVILSNTGMIVTVYKPYTIYTNQVGIQVAL